MSLRALKWSVPVDDSSHEMGTGQVLKVACQHDHESVQVWTLEDETTLARAPRSARAFATGQPLPGAAMAHIGTALAADGQLVWHLFEVLP